MGRLDLASWAARDLRRRPGGAFVLALGVAAVTAVVATALALHAGLERAAADATGREAALVVRRVDEGRFVPLPAALALPLARAIPGVVSARALPMPGLGGGLAAGLALEVFHESEADALAVELKQAFPWPVQVTSRAASRGTLLAGLGRQGAFVLFLTLPALLALALLALAVLRERLGARREMALLKVMGWTGADLVALHAWRLALVATPALLLGFGVTTWLVACPGGAWLARLCLGLDEASPVAWSGWGGLLVSFAQAGALVVAPLLLATLLPAGRAAAIDPALWLGEEAP